MHYHSSFTLTKATSVPWSGIVVAQWPELFLSTPVGVTVEPHVFY